MYEHIFPEISQDLRWHMPFQPMVDSGMTLRHILVVLEQPLWYSLPVVASTNVPVSLDDQFRATCHEVTLNNTRMVRATPHESLVISQPLVSAVRQVIHRRPISQYWQIVNCIPHVHVSTP
jgi:hypothetical protein